MIPRPLLLTVAAVPFILAGGGCPNHAIDPGPRVSRRADPQVRARGSDPDGPVRQQIETICDRMEDCAVERNVALARTYGGNAADIATAREQARNALHSGFVRRWCQQRLGSLTAPTIARIHRCLGRTACDPFFKCAKFVDSVEFPPPGARVLCARR